MKHGPDELIRTEIRALAAYKAPEPNDLIKLNTHENPYHWPPELVAEWLELLRDVHVNRYPDAGCRELKVALNSYLGLSPDTPLVLGNGSDELIQTLLMTLAGYDCCVLAPAPTFVMYEHCAVTLGARYVPVALEASEFSLDRERMLEAIERHRPALIFIAHPNNPTGTLFDRAVIDDIIAATPGLVIIDEAYAPFASDSYLGEVDRHENLLVMRTLSKVGLAGLRLGLLTGAPRWLEQIEKLRLPYNINTLTQVSAAFALEHKAVFDAQTKRICEDRARVFDRLSLLDGLTVYPSAANFITFRTPQGQAGRINVGLQRGGVSVKNLDGSDPLLADCLRASIGTPDENEAFLGVLAAQL